MLKRFERNTVGRDFVVGDIHGAFHHLKRALGELHFDPERDRLFSVGDLVDRGPHSIDVEQWLDKPWFHAVRGNHEDMALEYLIEGDALAVSYVMNGGGWFVNLPREVQKRIARRFMELPFAIEVDTERGRVGIVHAEVPRGRWHDYDGWNSLGSAGIEQALWARDKIQRQDDTPVDDIDHVYVGHTPKKHSVQLGNVHYIDTGAVWGKRLTIANLATGEEHEFPCYC